MSSKLLKDVMEEVRAPSSFIGPELRFPCDKCERSFRVMGNMETHKRNAHTSDPNCPASSLPTRFPCSICGKSFPKYNLKNHVATHEEPSFKCPHPDCPKSFHSEKNLGLHNRRFHLRLANHKSSYCDRTFIYPSYRDRHDKYHREKGVCLKAGEKAYRLNFLEKNNSIPEQNIWKGSSDSELILTKDPSPSTENCPARLQTKSSASTRLPCSICGNVFRTSWYLKKHLATHEEPSFKCPHPSCPKSFHTKQKLGMHNNRFHLRVANATSSFCGRAFIYPSDRDRHDRYHREKGICLKAGEKAYLLNFLERNGRLDQVSDICGKDEATKTVGRKRKIVVGLEEEKRGLRKVSSTQSIEVMAKSFQCKLCLIGLRTETELEQHMRDKHRVSVQLKGIQMSSRRLDEGVGGMCVLELENLAGTNADPLTQWFMCDKCSWAICNIETATAHSCCKSNDNDNVGRNATYCPEVIKEVEDEEVALILVEEIKIEFPDF